MNYKKLELLAETAIEALNEGQYGLVHGLLDKIKNEAFQEREKQRAIAESFAKRGNIR